MRYCLLQPNEIHARLREETVGERISGVKGEGELEEGCAPSPALITSHFCFPLIDGSVSHKGCGMFTATSQTIICLLISRGIMCWKKAAILVHFEKKK